MNWDKEIELFDLLYDDDVTVGASARENQRAVAMYNRALSQIQNGHNDVAMIALERITKEFPLFVEASHLYGICLAKQQNWAKAEKVFANALVSAPDEPEVARLEEARLIAREARIREGNKDSKASQRERVLSRVKADFARGGILEKADSSRRADRMRMATAKEREEVLAQIRSRENGRAPMSLADTGEGGTGLSIKILSAFLALIAVLVLVYFLIIAPAQKGDKQTDNLRWLEQQMEERAKSDRGVKDLWDDYNKYRK